MSDYEETYNEVWREIVENPDGSLNLDQIKRELHDYWFLMEQAAIVYCHITDSAMSKTTYYARDVIARADDVFTEHVEREIRENASPADGDT